MQAIKKYETLLFSVNEQIAIITFNRPTAMNCFDKQMADELEVVTENIRNDASIRAVVLAGAGNLFMAGGDINFFYENLEAMPDGVIKIVRSLNTSIMNMMQMPKPVLASVHGSVAGVGMSLMMACDLVIAAENTKFTMAYSGLGISPDGGASFNLPRLVGTKKAMEWILLPDIFDAKTAQSAGLINFVTSSEQLIDDTKRLATRLAHGPTQSYSHAKRLVNESWQHSLEKQLELEGRAFEACCVTADFRAGVTGFLKKNKPKFMGK